MSDNLPTMINEIKIDKFPQPVTIKSTETILNQMKNCICKIFGRDNGKASGFFCLINCYNNIIPTLITNYHVINEEYIKDHNHISISLNNDKNKKTIIIGSNRQTYFNEKYDIAIIEIKSEDRINNQYLELDDNIYKEIGKEFFINNSVYNISYPKGEEVYVSYGLTKDFENDYIVRHLCSTELGSSGSPILNLSNHKVIGLHKGGAARFCYNYSVFLKFPIDDFIQKYKNKFSIFTNIDNNISQSYYDINIIFNKNDDINTNNNKQTKNNKIFIGNNIINNNSINKNNNIIIRNNSINNNSINKNNKIIIRNNTINNNSNNKNNIFNNGENFNYRKCISNDNIPSNENNIININTYINNNINNNNNNINNGMIKPLIYKIPVFKPNVISVTNINKLIKNNKIVLKLNISKEDLNNKVYFLSKTFHKKCINKSNVEIFINNEYAKYEKYFIPKEIKEYTIIVNFKFKITDCSYMFCDCKNLNYIDLSDLDTKDVQNMSNMFKDCSNLSQINLTTFITNNVNNMEYMFCNCKSLNELNLSSFNTCNVINMNGMFYNCSNLLNIIFGSLFYTSKASMNIIFANCNKYTKLTFQGKPNNQLLIELGKK